VSRRRPGVVALATAVLVALGGCGDGDDDVALPAVSEIGPALDAVEDALGGAQAYFEVNATPALVNVFVATDGGATATAYVYLDGELQEPAPPRDVAGGATFLAESVDFDPDAVLDTVADELDDSVIGQFVVLGGPGGAVRYEVIVTSARGGNLSVVVGPDGEIVSVDPA
jgi:hypothetical protein